MAPASYRRRLPHHAAPPDRPSHQRRPPATGALNEHLVMSLEGLDASRARPPSSPSSTRVYRGPNFSSFDPAMHLLVDLGVLEDFPTNRSRASPTTWSCRCPGRRDHTCSRGRPGGFVERLHEGTWLGHVAEHVPSRSQRVGPRLRRGKTRQVRASRVATTSSTATRTSRSGSRRACSPSGWSTTSSRPTRASTSRTSSTSSSCAPSTPRSAPPPRRSSTRQSPATSRGSGSTAARPARPGRPRQADPRHDDLGDRLHRGRHRLRQGHDPAAARAPARSPSRSPCAPPSRRPPSRAHRVPRGRQAARRQPRARLCLNLQDEAGSARRSRSPRSSRAAAGSSSSTTHRQRLPVPDHRRHLAVAERVPAHVIGDGVSTVQQLVDLTNADPRRGVGHEKVLTDQDRRRRRGRARRPGPQAGRRARPRARWSSWR